jgi:peptide deformylase
MPKKKKNNGRMNICFYGNDVLKKKCKEVDEITPELVNTAKRMLITMRYNQGVGLAAPQVGLPIRLMVINIGEEDMIMFNPVIVSHSDKKSLKREACLSIPQVSGYVERFDVVGLEYLDEDGEKVILEADGYLANVIQHEVDHLDGIMFVDKLKSSLGDRSKQFLEIARKKGEYQNA